MIEENQHDEDQGGSRYCFLIDNLRYGGTQSRFFELAKYFCQSERRVHVICLSEGDADLISSFREVGAKVTILGSRSIILLVGLFRIWKILRDERPKLLLTALPVSDVVGRVVSRFGKSDLRLVSNLVGAKFGLGLVCGRLTASAVSKAVANSEFLLNQSVEREHIPKDRIVKICNGVREATLCPDRRRALREELGLTPGMVVIGSVGRLSAEKGYDILIKAFQILSRSQSDVLLVLIGDGPLMEKLKAGSEGVRFLGKKQDARAFLSAFDIYVQPSRAESMPNALLEAMAVGLPVIATDVGGVPEAVEDRNTGLLVKPGDPNLLVDSMKALISDDVLRERLSESGRHHVREKFSMLKMLQSYDDLFGMLTSDERPR